MSTTVREMRDQMASIWARLREMHEQAESEGRDLTEEERANWNAAYAEFQGIRERARRQEFLESMPAEDVERRAWQVARDREAGPPASAEEASAREQRAYEEAFRAYISAQSPRMLSQETWEALYRGATPLSEGEQRAMQRYRAATGTSTPSGGGFWVPTRMMERIEKALLWFGGMRQFVGEEGILTTDDGGDINWPVYDDTGNTGRRLAENTAATQTDLTVGVRVLKAYTYSSDEVLVSIQLLQDRPDLAETILADALGERVARAQNADFTNNGAPDGPQGLITATTVGVTAAAATAVTADELRNLKYSVNRAYRDHPTSAYMMHDQTLRDILGLKDGQGQYLFQPDPRDGMEPTIWGSRVVINNDMPTMATGVRAIVYGRGASYKIRQVRGFTLLRMDERYAPSLQVSFLGFARADGAFINAGQDPIKHLVMA